MAIQAVNPTTGATIKTYPEMTPAEVQSGIEKAHAAFLGWRQTRYAERARLMKRAAQLLREQAGAYATLMAQEMGKLVKDGRAEAEKCAWACDYYADNAEQFLMPEVVETDASKSFVTFQPLGVVLAVMPWNFPFWQVFRFAAPALMAGNAGVLKHASNVPRCALEIEGVFRAAGLPEGLFGTVLVGPPAVPALIADARIRAVTLTGSERAGSQVAERAGRELKKTVLELGGSDPFIVLEDADLPRAARTAASARLVNSGQSCIAAKRFIVVEKVAERFLELFVGEMRARKMGDPLARDTEVGPQARADLRDALDEEDAIRLANDSTFGLGASLWTASRERAERLAPLVEAGSVFVNGLVKSDPRLPFGGIKRSGYGRELSEFGIREFVNVKSVWIG